LAIDETHENWKANRSDYAEKKQQSALDLQIIEFLESREECTATQKDVLAAVTGRTERKIQAIKRLEAESVVSISGTPLTVHMEMQGDTLRLYRLDFSTNGKGQ